MRFKKTEICTTCAKVKNVCQTCILDLQYGLPVQVRDTALNIKQNGPTSDINREYFYDQMDKKLEGPTSLIESSAGPSNRAGQELLKKMARTDPGYKRNRAHLCSFYAKGACNRGDACPFRHELPVNNEMSKQNIVDRFHGRNDPVAKKMLSAHAGAQGLTPPEDKSVVSLFLSSLPPTVTEDEIRTFFITSVPTLQPHQIKSITLVSASKCAFVNFTSRQAAEAAAERCSIKVELGGQQVRVSWGRSRKGKKPASAGADAGAGARTEPETTVEKASDVGVES